MSSACARIRPLRRAARHPPNSRRRPGPPRRAHRHRGDRAQRPLGGGPRLGDPGSRRRRDGLVGGMTAALLQPWSACSFCGGDGFEEARVRGVPGRGVRASGRRKAGLRHRVPLFGLHGMKDWSRSLQLARDEGEIIELSWYGNQAGFLAVGEDFHARPPLHPRQPEVGVVARSRTPRHRRTSSERLELAVSLLRDPVFDAFLTGESQFEELPEVFQSLENGELDDLCRVINYPKSPDRETEEPNDVQPDCPQPFHDRPQPSAGVVRASPRTPRRHFRGRGDIPPGGVEQRRDRAGHRRRRNRLDEVLATA